MLATSLPPLHIRAQAALEYRRRLREQETDVRPTDEAWSRYRDNVSAFVTECVQIYDATMKSWIPFHLWEGQRTALETMQDNRLVVVLKSRQLGLSFLCLADALHQMVFHPAATISLFSRRDDDAVYLMSQDRMRGMYQRLPEWVKERQTVVKSNDHEWQLSNGSVARVFPTSAGDSYTASYALVDEADLVPDLDRLMRAVKPTIDGGGRMVLISRVDKSAPLSEFKQIYRGAKAGENGWAGVFLPWYVRPSRDAAWYEAQRRDIFSRTGALDDLHEQYPASDTEALSPKSLDKRIPMAWLEQCYLSLDPLADIHGIPGLTVYRLPLFGRKYVCGADPAEGNPTSDDSAATWIDVLTGEEVASLKGKFEPAVLAAHIDRVGRWYHNAAVLPERNNHGHALILWLEDNATTPVLAGYDGRAGWYSSSKGKSLLYDAAATAFRERSTVLHTFETYMQLTSIEGASLLAPQGQMDDLADSYALALLAGTLLFETQGWSTQDMQLFVTAVNR